MAVFGGDIPVDAALRHGVVQQEAAGLLGVEADARGAAGQAGEDAGFQQPLAVDDPIVPRLGQPAAQAQQGSRRPQGVAWDRDQFIQAGIAVQHAAKAGLGQPGDVGLRKAATQALQQARGEDDVPQRRQAHDQDAGLRPADGERIGQGHQGHSWAVKGQDCL